MKVLCVCQGGNVRSVALATRLKQKHRVDALACGLEKNAPATVALLCEWADRIVVMETRFVGLIPECARWKVESCDVGPDRFHRADNPELQALIRPYATELWRRIVG